MQEVTLYTDGGARGNPGPGGWGALLIYGEHRRELSGGFCLTTNNRMELTAVIEGLAALKRPCAVTVYSDSRYVVDAMEKGWARRWKGNGWIRTKKGEPAVNPDLWARLLELCAAHRVRFVWVKGHAGQAENERCDALSVEASKREDLPPDPGYPEPLLPPGTRVVQSLFPS